MTIEFTSSDFVTKYKALLARITDAPEEFQEASALFLLSTAVGRKWILQSVSDAPIFNDDNQVRGKLLNLWFIIIGKSRITRKTRVITNVETAINSSLGQNLVLSEDYTPEALISEMAKKSSVLITDEKVTICCWIRDEASGFFNQIRKKDSYMATVDASLSKIYDGTSYRRETTARGLEVISNPYLTCFLASTEYLPTLFKKEQILVGFLNRFIFVVGKRIERKPLRDKPLDEEENVMKKEIISFLKAINDKTTVTALVLSDKAKQCFDCFDLEIENRIQAESLGLKEGYCAQLPNLVARLACLYRISRMTESELKDCNKQTVDVDVQDVERAIVYSKKAWDWFGEVIDLMDSSDYQKFQNLN